MQENFKEQEEPGVEPECTATEEQKEEASFDCEFTIRDGQWWCTTHNCSA